MNCIDRRKRCCVLRDASQHQHCVLLVPASLSTTGARLCTVVRGGACAAEYMRALGAVRVLRAQRTPALMQVVGDVHVLWWAVRLVAS